ncbi:MAG TPA: pentapeptide repeat-containing protein [Candidatus Brocadiales bacterium]|nr:pentapeptide repeat-containing protein [Candidatus Brocadiales bacterium]
MKAEKPKKQDPSQFTPGEKKRLEAQKLSLEVHKLNLEVQELKEKFTRRRKISRLVPIIVPSIALLGLIIGASVIFLNEGKRHRLEAITNLKRELASEHNAVRIGAVRALADYPKEGLPTLIACLGSTKLKEGQPEFASAVRASLRHVGKEAVYPLRNELYRIQDELLVVLGQDEITGQIYPFLPLAIFDEFDRVPDDVPNRIKEITRRWNPNLGDKETARVMERLLRSSSYNALVTHRNGRYALADIIREHRIGRLQLEAIDLSGTYLRKANLSDANLQRAALSNAYLGEVNLSGANLQGADLSGANLRDANLSGANLRYTNLSGAYLGNANLSDANLFAANLSGANLRHTNLSDANLLGADLSGANLFVANLSDANLQGASLSGADLRDAILTGLNGFTAIIDFTKTDLRGVVGLSREELEYTKSKGAIIDEPTVKEMTTETQKQG